MMDERPSVSVNGRQRPLEARVLDELLRELGYDPQGQGFAVAINGEVVRRGEWPERKVEADDHIEIIGAVQGG